MSLQRKNYRKKHLVDQGSLTVPATIEVIQANKNQYVFAWKQGESTIKNPDAFGSVARMLMMMDGMTIKLAYSRPDMGYQGVPNAQQIRQKARKRIDNVLNLPGQQLNAAQRQKFRRSLRTMLGHRRSIDAILTQNIKIYLFPYSWSLAPGSTYAYNDLIPNPIGGKALPSKAKLRLEERQNKKGRWVLNFDQKLTKKGSKRLKRTIMKKVIPKGQRPSSIKQLPDIKITDEGKHQINPETDWVIRSEQIRTIDLGQRRRIDITTFKKEPLNKP
jgi:hypothetical protein